MRRLFWIALGATAGVLVVRKASSMVHKLTPGGMAEGVADAGGRAQGALADFGSSVAMHAAQREADLRSALGLDGASDQDDDGDGLDFLGAR